MQYVDRDNLLDVQSIVYDYSKINPCIFNNASSGCCTVVSSDEALLSCHTDLSLNADQEPLRT